MAGSSRNASPIKRLMTELQTYQHDSNDSLYELGPTDDDVMQWRAVMKGVEGTAYEGTQNPAHISLHRLQHHHIHLLTPLRRLLAPLHRNSFYLPAHPTHDPLRNAHLPPQRRFQDGRDLPRFAQNRLDTRIYHLIDPDEYTPIAH